MITYQCLVSGRVQGVYYRSYVRKMASGAGYKGYVKNLPDGDVEACVTLTEEKDLQQFIEILKIGSPHCNVEQIKTEKISKTFTGGFVITR